MRLVAILAACAVLAAAPAAQAEIRRYAVLIGQNVGDAEDEPLRYAEDDARKLQDVLRSLGELPPENVTLLLGPNARSVTRALEALTGRLRAATAAGDDVVLFVYYSGHADAEALHLAGTHLALADLERLVRAAPARLRLLVLDSCRSGAITRAKGGTPVVPFAIALDERLAGEGLVILASSSANEDAQESDELKGSFFTHYFVSALRGSGDDDGDGKVSLREAYGYAYAHTLRATSKTQMGAQHPTFRYELEGQGDLVLTRRAPVGGRIATLEFPPGRTYLIFRDDAEGPVIAEVGPQDRRRSLAVPPGRYYVRGRASDFLLEGMLEVEAGEARTIADRLLHRSSYVRLARKGNSPAPLLHGPQAGYRLRFPLWNDGGRCHGLAVGWAFRTSGLTYVPQLTACTSRASNGTVTTEGEELGLELRVVQRWDVPWITIEAGVTGGAQLLRQRFTDTEHPTSDRDSLAGLAALSVGAAAEIFEHTSVYLEADEGVYLFQLEDEGLEAAWVLRTTVGLALRF